MSRWGVKTSKAQDEQMFSGLPFEADLDLRVNEYTCPCRKLDSAIMVMKSAEDRPRCDAAYVLDGMVDTLATNRSDQSFREAVLPRRAWGNGLVADAHGP
jgi:hypothetical protein